ncbi:histone deacetylase [Elasticomyces elasticus]|nr:histone deacetylase [Elasticomyces elasticus]KAK3655502.1 histone deacetylase [Elasticomyces elasticus]KAK5752557.1 histone deacetylase [Elasticomyces elasticus]
MSLGKSSPKLTRKTSRQSLAPLPSEEEKQTPRPTPKRSISNLIANLREASSQGNMGMSVIEEPIPLTASQIASAHFAAQLALQEDGSVEDVETVVILHDACYGHRYSRPKATKSTLSMIVERPERIHAAVLGAAAAFVRLGEHHSGGRNAPSPSPSLRTGSGSAATPPPFKIRKSDRAMDITSSYVTNVHGTAWMFELKGMCGKTAGWLASGAKELSRSSSPTSTGEEKRALHSGDLYLAPESLAAFQGALGGVADAVDAVFNPSTQTKRAFVAIRPPGHHCSADYPSGFCWVNNVHVGIEYAAQTHGLTHAAILDFDLHHGDGSQAITWERNARTHAKKLQNAGRPAKNAVKLGPDIGYPCEMGDDEKVQSASLCIESAHGQSIHNIHLQSWTTLDEFWALYSTHYSVLIDKARAFLRLHTHRLRAEGKEAKAAVFLSAGFDASEWEGSGMQRHAVNVPTGFYARFTRDVVVMAQEECGGRVVSVLEGGYSDRALCSGVMSHLSGLCGRSVDEQTKAGGDRANEQAAEPNSLDALMNGLKLNGTSSPPPQFHYDKEWWSEPNLTALEMKVNPPPIPALQGKRIRTGPQPTYATPTESFAYKVIDPNKFARSISGTMREAPAPRPRPRTPEPESVNWVVATQELSKLLVPADRQTRSCTAEELGGVKVKKEGGSVVPGPGAVVGGMEGLGARQLRDRKGIRMPAAYAEGVGGGGCSDDGSARSVSRASSGGGGGGGGGRRQTVHELPSAANGGEGEGEGQQFQRRASRRLSAGGAFGSLDGVVGGGEVPPVPKLPLGGGRPPLGTATTNGGMRPPAVSTATGGIQVKKMRAPVGRPRKISPNETVSNTDKPAVVKSLPGTNGVSTPVMSAEATALDVDKLASGMKKISLKVGSREESERKAKEREAAERRARALKGAETRRVNAAARKAATTVNGGGVVAQPVAVQKSAASVEVVIPPPATDGPGTGIERNGFGETHVNLDVVPPAPFDAVVEGTSTLPKAETITDMQRLGLNAVEPDNEPTVMSHQPEASLPPDVPEEAPSISPSKAQDSEPSKSAVLDQTPSTSPAHASASVLDQRGLIIPDSAARQLIQENNIAHGLAPLLNGNSSSPIARSPLEGKPLPVFSSTGHIPFGPSTAPSWPATKTKAKSPPPFSSPIRDQSLGVAAGGPGLRNISGHGNGVSRSMLDSEVEEEITQGPTPGVDEKDIWEVPDTPARF